MKTKTVKTIIVSLLLVGYIFVGFFREFLFLNINEQSRVTYYHDTDSHVANSMSWLSQLSYPTLYYAKYPLTLFFTIFFALLSGLIIKFAFEDKTLVRITWFAFATVFVTGLLFYLAGALTGNPEATYDIARFLAGLTETPALLVILAASFLALRRK